MDTKIVSPFQSQSLSGIIARPRVEDKTAKETTGTGPDEAVETFRRLSGTSMSGDWDKINLRAAHQDVVTTAAAPTEAHPADVPSALQFPGEKTASPPSPHKLGALAKAGALTALALTGLGLIEGMAPTAAMAATFRSSVSQTTGQTQETRVQTPVTALTPQDVISKFDARHQFYYVPRDGGSPMFAGKSVDLTNLQTVLKNHPHAYVVLVDGDTREELGDDSRGHWNDLATGIGNSSQFRGVVNSATGQSDGTLYVFFLDVNGDTSGRGGTAKLFYRAEELPTQLGYGVDFANGQMLRIFATAKSAGKDLAGSVEAVMNTVDGAIADHAAQVGQEAEASKATAAKNVAGAKSALDGFKVSVQKFQKEHGSGGELGSPNVAGFEGQLKRAQDALSRGNYDVAAQASDALVASLETPTSAMAQYGQAPEIAKGVQKQMKEVGKELGALAPNSHTTAAQQKYDVAKAQYEQYNTDYEAKNPRFWSSLQNARQALSDATQDVSAAQSATKSAEHTRDVALGVVALSLLALGVISAVKTKAAQGKAQLELNEAINEIGDKAKQLQALASQADFMQVSGYQGKTKQLADDLIKDITDALTLVGGLNKFLNTAESMVNGNFIKNMFTWGGDYRAAVDLLTNPEHKLTFSFTDDARKVMQGDKNASSWIEQASKAGNTREFQMSMKEILVAMAEKHDKLVKNMDEIQKKDASISTYLDEIQKDGATAKDKAAKLQTASSDKLFAAPSVTDNLLPMVLGEKDGLLAKGRAAKDHDPVRAWDEFGTPAKRMATEADQIVGVAMDARQTLVPTMQKADAALQPNGVKTEWAHDAAKGLSDRLDKAANNALRTSVTNDVNGIKQDVSKLGTRIETTVSQDKQRREVCPGLIADAEKDVDTARKELAQKLQAAGAFKAGKPDQVLREKDRDPSSRTQDAHKHHEAVKASLDTGDIETAGQHLVAVHDLSADAHKLVKDTRDAFETYPAMLDERQKRTSSIDASIGSLYQPSLDRIKRTYQSEVLQLVAPDVNAGATVADCIDRTRKNLTDTRGLTKDAQANFDKAMLLASRDELAQADTLLKTAQGNLDAITNAEMLLAKKQTDVEALVRKLDGSFATTAGNANQSFVRDHARQMLQQARDQLERARRLVSDAPKNPYRAGEGLKVAENQRGQVESAIEADRRAYESARQSISSAESEIASAQTAIAGAAMQSWSWSNGQGTASASVSASDLFGAQATLASASQALGQARGQLSGQDYEGAARSASAVSSQAAAAVAEAEAAVESARGRYESEKNQLIALQEEEDERRRAEERRREEEAAAERRRQEESHDVSGGWSSGGGGGDIGGGGGGSGGGGGDI